MGKLSKGQLQIIKKLAARYHTLPLNTGELRVLCRRINVDPVLARQALEKAVNTGLFSSLSIMGRTIVYLDEKKLQKK